MGLALGLGLGLGLGSGLGLGLGLKRVAVAVGVRVGVVLTVAARAWLPAVPLLALDAEGALVEAGADEDVPLLPGDALDRVPIVVGRVG